jgi:hypothetical protein
LLKNIPLGFTLLLYIKSFYYKFDLLLSSVLAVSFFISTFSLEIKEGMILKPFNQLM